MIGLSWELAGYVIVFQVLQAIVAGTMIALLLLYEKRARASRQRGGGPA